LGRLMRWVASQSNCLEHRIARDLLVIELKQKADPGAAKGAPLFWDTIPERLIPLFKRFLEELRSHHSDRAKGDHGQQ
jgi:hypothetical protein